MQGASHRRLRWLLLAACCIRSLGAQTVDAPGAQTDVIARLAPVPGGATHKIEKPAPAVIWLNPLRRGSASFVAHGNFTLLQKNKMFTPHLLVVPVGSSVAFPNADPFFHNVFSLFDGRRFDLGLYEAGSTRSVVFSREGVSYIFCNIHSEMSAVVISLATPLYGFADTTGTFHIKGVPEGDYNLHIWIEGQKQSSLDLLTRHVSITKDISDLGEIHPDHPTTEQHLNKFGRPYEPEKSTSY